MPSWLAVKLGQYPNVRDYEVATEAECETYWNELVPEDLDNKNMSRSFKKLSLMNASVEITENNEDNEENSE